jgi:prophage regulatory protein
LGANFPFKRNLRTTLITKNLRKAIRAYSVDSFPTIECEPFINKDLWNTVRELHLFYCTNRPTRLCSGRTQTNQRGFKMADTIQRLRAIISSTSLSRSTIYLRIANGVFTKPVSLGGRAVGWPSSEVAALQSAWVSGKSEAEVRALVLALQAARKTDK